MVYTSSPNIAIQRVLISSLTILLTVSVAHTRLDRTSVLANRQLCDRRVQPSFGGRRGRERGW